MFLRCFFAVATFTLGTAAAQADTFQVFDLNAKFNALPVSLDYQTVTGTITIDTTIGTVTATDLTLTVYDTQGNPEGTEELGGAGFSVSQGPIQFVTQFGQTNLPTFYSFVISNFEPGHPIDGLLPTSTDYMNYLSLLLPVASLVDYEGGTLCARGECFSPGLSGEGTISYLERYSVNGIVGGGHALDEGTLLPEATTVPEPSTFTLIVTGMAGLAGAFCRQREDGRLL